MSIFKKKEKIVKVDKRKKEKKIKIVEEKPLIQPQNKLIITHVHIKDSDGNIVAKNPIKIK